MEDRLHEFLELVRRYDEANGTDPVPDQVKKACIVSNTPEPLKTHLQLNVAELGNFNALRVATEDCLRSRRIFKTTSAGNTHDEDSMEVDAISRKGKGKENLARARRVARKEKQATQAKATGKRQQNTHDSMVNVETVESMDTKHLIVGTSRRTNLKVRGSGKSKSKVTEFSESDSSKQDTKHVCTATKFISSEHDWMRR